MHGVRLHLRRPQVHRMHQEFSIASQECPPEAIGTFVTWAVVATRLFCEAVSHTSMHIHALVDLICRESQPRPLARSDCQQPNATHHNPVMLLQCLDPDTIQSSRMCLGCCACICRVRALWLQLKCHLHRRPGIPCRFEAVHVSRVREAMTAETPQDFTEQILNLDLDFWLV